MPEVLGALPTALTQVEWERLDAYLKKFPNRAALKRLGVLVEAMDLSIPNREVRLHRWRRMLSGGIALLDPGGRRTAGRIHTAWGMRVNIPIHPGHPA